MMDKKNHMITWIGSRVRFFRHEKNLKLSDLSELTEVSTAMLSKIENGRVFPTFPTLLKILNSLKVNLNDFFESVADDDEFPGYILIKEQDYIYTPKEENSEGFYYENILTHNMKENAMEISMLTLSPNAKREKVSTDGFEFIHMIKGNVSYQLEDKLIPLNTGDSLFFDGRIPHVPYNNSNKECKLLVFYFITQE